MAECRYAPRPVAGRLSSPRLVESIRQFDKRLKPYESTVQVREFRAYLDRQLATWINANAV